MKKLLFIFLLLTGCASVPPNSEQVTLLLVVPADMGQYCDVGALGCAKESNGACYIYAPKPPEKSYTGVLTSSYPKEYTIIGHELMHCYGWEH